MFQILSCQLQTSIGNQPSSSVLCDELVKHNLFFEYAMASGRVGKIFAKNHEREEILNVKRGIVNTFQVPRMPEGLHKYQEVITLQIILSSIKCMSFYV